MPERIYTYVSSIIFRTHDKSDRDDNGMYRGAQVLVLLPDECEIIEMVNRDATLMPKLCKTYNDKTMAQGQIINLWN